VWLEQVQILNIPPENRRDFQFVCGVYYSRRQKPCMTTFLKPFVDMTKDLFTNGFNWFDKINNSMRNGIVIAPITSLDAPARSDVQNITRYNGECGCTFCEHPGEIFKLEEGLTEYIPLPIIIFCREHVNECSRKLCKHPRKRSKRAVYYYSLIPAFNVATSFVSDYMHAILLGIFRMLTSLWFNSKNHSYPFYIQKPVKDQINSELQKIFPPVTVTCTPRTLKYIHYWKK
ncbi:hypothetical protein TSAR_007148, partial [Trichomalopsis sarcophagae]